PAGLIVGEALREQGGAEGQDEKRDACGESDGHGASRKPKKKGGPPKWPPILQRQVSGLELVPDADANADRHLELRRVAPEDRADRLAEVRIRRSVGQLRVLVVIEHAALVEEVEDVREQRRSTPTDCPERVGRLQIHLAL